MPDDSGQLSRARVKAGWPDLTGCLPPDGRLLAVECKTARDELRPEQTEVLERLSAAGALVCVPRSVDDLRAALETDGGPIIAARLKRLHFQS